MTECNSYTKTFMLSTLEQPCVNFYYAKYSSELLKLNSFSKCLKIGASYSYNAISERELLKCKGLDVGGDWHFVKTDDACLGSWTAGVLLKVYFLGEKSWIIANILKENIFTSDDKKLYHIQVNCLHYGLGGTPSVILGGLTAKETIAHAIESLDALLKNDYALEHLIKDLVEAIQKKTHADHAGGNYITSGKDYTDKCNPKTFILKESDGTIVPCVFDKLTNKLLPLLAMYAKGVEHYVEISKDEYFSCRGITVEDTMVFISESLLCMGDYAATLIKVPMGTLPMQGGEMWLAVHLLKDAPNKDEFYIKQNLLSDAIVTHPVHARDLSDKVLAHYNEFLSNVNTELAGNEHSQEFQNDEL